VTDTAIAAWVIDQFEYREALKNFREADKIMNILSVAEKAMGQRKYMIQSAVQLFISQYYSEPNTNTKEAGKELKRDARNKAISEKVSEKMRGRRSD
jgi:ssRNA-specific RNase YbeY (16S rRNA maturation enzyme)